ncbi:hypothetical protein D3C85_1239720 [compost metagenome]
MDIGVFVVCDADTDKTREDEIQKHKKDNAAILHLLGHDKSESWPDRDLKKSNLRMWKTNITNTIFQEFGGRWNEHEDRAAAHYGNVGGLKKNPLAVSRALESAWTDGLKSTTLQELVNNILDQQAVDSNKSTQPTADTAVD